MGELVVGLDLGGTQIRTILADATGTALSRHDTLTKAHEGPASVLARIINAIEGVMPKEGVAAIGVGAPGPTDPEHGMILMGPNLPGWHNVNLRDLLGEHFHRPVFVGNDANLAGLAEHRFGAGKGVSHMIYITVSTGIGTGIIVDNRMLLGRQGLAAEIGHMTIDVSAEDMLWMGQRVTGTLEGLASGPRIALRAQAALAAGAHSAAVELVQGDLSAISPRVLNEAALRGDAFAIEQFRLTGRYLGIGITNMLHTFNPDRIVMGGSVWTHAQDLMMESLWETIRNRSKAPEYWQDLTIVSAALGHDVGSLGAVALAFDGLSGTRVA